MIDSLMMSEFARPTRETEKCAYPDLVDNLHSFLLGMFCSNNITNLPSWAEDTKPIPETLCWLPLIFVLARFKFHWTRVGLVVNFTEQSAPITNKTNSLMNNSVHLDRYTNITTPKPSGIQIMSHSHRYSVDCRVSTLLGGFVDFLALQFIDNSQYSGFLCLKFIRVKLKEK